MVNKKAIEEIIDNILSNKNLTEKCSRSGTKPSSGVQYGQGEMPRFESNNEKLSNDELNEIADTMAERWGLEVSINEKGKREIGATRFSLWDDEHKTLIRLNKIVKHQEWIDFTNNGKGAYNLDEVLSYYNDLTDLQKEHTGAILFETKMGASWNHPYDKSTDTINPIHISANVYYEKNGEFNMRQIMGHEIGHACERSIDKEEANVLRKSCVGNNTYRKTNLTSDREKQVYENILHGDAGDSKDVSRSSEYLNARLKNKVFHASQYSESYSVYNDNNTEDFAEVMSAVSFRNANDKSRFHIRYSDGKLRDWNTFVNDHKETYNLCCDYVDGKINPKDLHKPSYEDLEKWSNNR